MKSFTKKLFVLALFITSILSSTLAIAAAIDDVTNTKHNFAIGGSARGAAAAGTGQVQVCIYCHTPHNAVSVGPLWNKANTTVGTVFKLYTSSPSLSSATKASTLTANSPSLLCLGCHDGKTAMNILHNTSYGVDAASVGIAGYPAGTRVITADGGAVNGAFVMQAPVEDLMSGTGLTPENRIGGASGDNLTDDHPIGFSYSAAYGEKPTKLRDTIDPQMSSIRFFGPEKRVECSTCHNPHLDPNGDIGFAPFLVKSNASSALCLSCHDK